MYVLTHCTLSHKLITCRHDAAWLPWWRWGCSLHVWCCCRDSSGRMLCIHMACLNCSLQTRSRLHAGTIYGLRELSVVLGSFALHPFYGLIKHAITFISIWKRIKLWKANLLHAVKSHSNSTYCYAAQPEVMMGVHQCGAHFHSRRHHQPCNGRQRMGWRTECNHAIGK